MKKRYIIFFSLVLISLFFVSSPVNGEEKLSIVDINFFSDNSEWDGILYSDHRLLYKVGYDEVSVIENVEKFIDDRIYLTTDGIFHYYGKEYKNVVYFDNISYKDKSNNLYVVDSKFNQQDDTPIATNVDKVLNVYSNRLLYTTYDGEFYVIGDNIYGIKINEGQYLSTPYKLADSVREFGSTYFITNDNQLYVFDKSLPRPLKAAEDVDKVYRADDIVVFYTKLGSNNLEFINRSPSDDIPFRKITTYEFNSRIKTKIGDYILLEDGTLYSIYNMGVLEVIDTNVKEVQEADDGALYLKKNGDLYQFSEDGELTGLAKFLLKSNTCEEKARILRNVETIKYYPKYNGNILIMKDGRTYEFVKVNDYQHNVLKQVDELFTQGKTIRSEQIVLSTNDNTDITVGESYDYYATVIPFNAVDREVLWTSSNPDVAVVDNTGYVTALREGKANICVTLKTNNTISNCNEVTVHPKINKVEIINGDMMVVKPYRDIILTAKTYPEDALDIPINWKGEGVTFSDLYYDGIKDQYIEVSNNQIVVRVDNRGTFNVTVEVNGVSDTIKLTTEDKVADLDIYLDGKLYSGDANIYLDEQDFLLLNIKSLPVGSTINNSVISCSDSNIISVDEDNSKLDSKMLKLNKTGQVKLNITVNDTIEKEIILNILDKRPHILGDLDNNSQIEIFDIMELLYIVSGKKEQTEEIIKIGDMDNNGDIDIFDVMELLYIYTGKKS